MELNRTYSQVRRYRIGAPVSCTNHYIILPLKLPCVIMKLCNRANTSNKGRQVHSLDSLCFLCVPAVPAALQVLQLYPYQFDLSLQQSGVNAQCFEWLGSSFLFLEAATPFEIVFESKRDNYLKYFKSVENVTSSASCPKG